MPQDDMNVEKTEQLQVSAAPDRIIPKLATKVTVARSDSGTVILSFIFALPGESAHLVERITVDDKTASELSELLKSNDTVEEKNAK